MLQIIIHFMVSYYVNTYSLQVATGFLYLHVSLYHVVDSDRETSTNLGQEPVPEDIDATSAYHAGSCRNITELLVVCLTLFF
jgi:hypothetical protein